MRYNPLEREGVASFEKFISKSIKWIPREQPIADVGIDCIIECIDIEGNPNGIFIAAQLKSGLGNVTEKKDCFTYYVAKKHYKYWNKVAMPMLLIFYNPNDEKLYWIRLNKATQIKTKKGYKVNIPKQNDLSTKSSVLQFKLLNEELSNINNLITNLSAAKILFEETEQILPNNTDNLNQYAFILFENGMFSEAARLFNRAYKLDLEANDNKPSLNTVIRKLNFCLIPLTIGKLELTKKIAKQCKKDLNTINQKQESKIFCNLYNLLGQIKHSNQRFKKGIKYFNKAINISDDIDDQYERLVSRNNLGRLLVDYAVTKNLNKLMIYKGLDNLHEAYKIANEYETELLDKKDIILSNIGSAYYYLKDFKRSISNYKESIEIQIKRYGDKHHAVANRYLNLANAYFNIGNQQKAGEYQELAKEIYLDTYKTELHPRIALLYFNKGARLIKSGDPIEGKIWIKKSLNIEDKLKIKSKIIEFGLSQLTEKYDFNLE